jgi:hypothetical protein
VTFDLRSEIGKEQSFVCSSVAETVAMTIEDANGPVGMTPIAWDPLHAPLTVDAEAFKGGFERGPVLFSAEVLNGGAGTLFEGSTEATVTDRIVRVPIQLQAVVPVLEICISVESQSLWFNVTNRGTASLEWWIVADTSNVDPAKGCFDETGEPIPCIAFSCEGQSFTLRSDASWFPSNACKNLSDGNPATVGIVMQAPPDTSKYSFRIRSNQGDVPLDIVPVVGKSPVVRLRLPR